MQWQYTELMRPFFHYTQDTCVYKTPFLKYLGQNKLVISRQFDS